MMMINYLLLLVTGAISTYGGYHLIKGNGRISGLFTVVSGVVFALVLAATVMGLDYNSFRMMIEAGLSN